MTEIRSCQGQRGADEPPGILEMRTEKLPTLIFHLINRIRDDFMLHHDRRIVTHRGTNNLHGINDKNRVRGLTGHHFLLWINDDYLLFGRWGHHGNGVVHQDLILTDYILLADFLEAVVGAFQQVGQHRFYRFVGAGILFNFDFAHFRFAECDIDFVIGKQFFQGFVQGTRLHRKRNQGVERLGEASLWYGKGKKEQ